MEDAEKQTLSQIREQYNNELETTLENLLPKGANAPEHRAILEAVTLMILAEYLSSENEPFYHHPGDEYFIGNLSQLLKEPKAFHNWIAKYTQYDGEMSAEDFEIYGTQLHKELRESCGHEKFKGPVPIGIEAQKLIRPPAGPRRDRIMDYTPGDGLFENGWGIDS